MEGVFNIGFEVSLNLWISRSNPDLEACFEKGVRKGKDTFESSDWKYGKNLR
jgi:hypothetical protein